MATTKSQTTSGDDWTKLLGAIEVTVSQPREYYPPAPQFVTVQELMEHTGQCHATAGVQLKTAVSKGIMRREQLAERRGNIYATIEEWAKFEKGS